MRRLRRSVHRSSSRRALRLFAPVVAGILVTSAPAFAQAPETQKEDITLPGVDVRGQRREYKIEQSDLFKFPDLLKDTPQSITIIPQEVMRQQASFNLRDVLRNVAGISLAAGEGGGAQGDNLTLRGFSARNDMFIDGMRDLGQYARDTFNLEAVEVLKGPSSVMFGRGSTGGVINQVSKVPSPTAGYTFSQTAGSGPTFRTTMDLNQPLNDSMALRLNLMYYNAGTPGRDDVFVERWGVAPSFAIALGPSTKLVASYYTLSDDNRPEYGFPYVYGNPAPVGRNTYYGVRRLEFEQDIIHVGTIRLEHAFNEDVRLRNQTRVAHYQRNALVTPPGTLAGNLSALDTIQVVRTPSLRDQEDANIANNTDVVVTFPTGPVKHTLVTGVEVARESSDVSRWSYAGVPNTSLLNPDPLPNLRALRRTKITDTSTDALAIGVFAVDEIAITEQWKLMAGVRYDHFDADTFNRFLHQDFSSVDDVWSPRAALVYQPTPQQTYYFSYGTSFNPSAEAIALAINNVGAEAEKNRAYELGAKWDLFESKLGLRFAAFQIEKTNARTTDPLLGVQVTDGLQRVRGFEVEAVGRLLPGWNIFANYSFLDSRVVDSKDIQAGIEVKGKRIANVPDSTASLWTTWDITPQWQVGGGAVYVGHRWANNNNTNEAQPFVRGDLTAAYRPWKPLELRLNVINISDETYFDQVHPSHIIPGAARTFLFTGTLTF